MTEQDASTSEAEADNHIKPKTVRVKTKHGRDQDQSTPAKKPRHREIKENNRKWECAICSVGFRFWNELDVHVMSAHEEKNQWECEYCGRTYSTKENLDKHVRNKHKQKKKLIPYECMHCRKTEDTFDAAVYHAQVHLVQEALSKQNGTLYKQAFDNHKKSVNNSTLIKIKFDYKTLLKDAWFNMFQDLLRPLEIKVPSLYKYTRCVKLNWDSRSKREEEGRCVLLYQCGVCKLIVKPAKVQKHCDKNGACVEGGLGYKCKECQISFYTPNGLKRHKTRHKNNQVVVKIATFNNKDDIHFNNILKQISHSSVDDTDEDTELEEISRNPGTLNVSEKNVDVQAAKHCVQCKQSYFDFEAHNAYHENKKNGMLETFLGQIQPLHSVKAGANIVSPGENVSITDNTRKVFIENRSKVQDHKENIVEASKDNDSDRIENDPKSAVVVWDRDNDSNDSNRQSPPQLNLKRSFAGVFTKKDEIIQKNRNINSGRNPKEGRVEKNDQNDQSAIKRRRISGEENNPGGMLEADKSQSTEGQRALEDNVESVHSHNNSEENEDFDQRDQEVQEHTGTTANIGTVNKPVSVESGVLQSSEYISLNGNMAILHGSFSQEHLRFNSSRGKQCTGIAAVACAAFSVLDPNVWTKNVIDKIVVIGDKYYNSCIANRPLPAAGEVNPDYLAVTDLMPTIIFNKLSVPIVFEEETNLNGHIDNDDSFKGFPNLKNALKLLFRRRASGILTSNAMSVAVYCKALGETYWLFDSHSRGPEGALAFGGAACCMRFSHLDDLHDLLRRNFFESPSEFPKGRDLIINQNVFSLTSLSVREPMV